MATKANIGSLIVSVLANTTGFDTGMKKAGKTLTVFEKKMQGTQNVVGGLGKALGAIGVAFSAGALISKLQDTAKSLDALAKQSAKIGILPEKLAALQFAGEQTGVAADTMANALTKLQIRTSEAAKGAGEAVNVFGELGLRARDIQKLSPDKQFLAIATAMQKVEGQSDKMRIATKLFEEEGVALVNTLALGEDGLKQMEEQAKALGLALSQEELAKVEAFNDAWNRLSKSVTAIGNEIVISISPAATKFADSLAEAVEGLKLQADTRKIQGKAPGIATRAATGQMHWQKSIEDWLIGRQLKQGVAAGTAAPDVIKQYGVRGVALARASQPGFNPQDVQRAFDSANIVEKNEAKRIADDPIRKALIAGSHGLEQFVKEDLPDGWRKLGLFGKRAEVWLREQEGARLNPSNEVLGRRERMQAILDRRKKQGETEQSPQFAAALMRGTVEAWQAARADTVPKQQLEYAKQQTSLLADIRDGVRRGGLIEVGIN